MPQPIPSASPTEGRCPMVSLPKPPDSTIAWDRAWPQTRCEFEALVDAYLDRLVRHAYGKLGNLQDAEDVVQEVLVRAFMDRFERKRINKVGPYLYRSVANACTDQLRKRGSRIFVRDENCIDEMPDQGGSPSNRVEAADELRRIEGFLGQLPQAQADIVRLRVLEGLRLKEIAEVVGCSVNTVSSRLRYGFRKLRSLVAEGRD